LEKGLSASTSFDCPGYFSLGGGHTLKCWKTSGHGTGIDMELGIEQSCNVYFCSLGQKCGYYAIREMALNLGLGKKSGIGLDGEADGRLPPARAIRRLGDIANTSIGQGAVEATPVQLAVLAGAIGMGGRVCSPRLLISQRSPGDAAFVDLPATPLKNLGWASSTGETIRRGMRRVVHAPNGTGRNAKIDDQTIMGGKTGTAEFALAGGNHKKWGWMMVFAPYESPRYAVAMLVENADSGGRTVGPRMRQLMSGIFGKKVDNP